MEDVSRTVSSSAQRWEDFKAQTEASLDALHTQLVALQAELAGARAGGSLDGPSDRLGHQVLQLSSVLQRVVQSQAALSQKVSGAASEFALRSRFPLRFHMENVMKT